MTEYADYNYYKEQFHGIVIPESAFLSEMLKAGIYINYITFGRVHDTEIPEEIRMAACAVADVMYQGDTGRQEVKSETVGKVSVSYVTEQQDGQIKERAREKKQYTAAYPYLVHTGLLNRGVRQ